MEPRAAVAKWGGDALTVWAGAQRPFGLRSELASRFDLDESSVRVLTPDIGGGFGGKSIFAPAAEAARLARVAGRPVRVAYTRAEEQTWATFRPAALIQIKSGFRNDGTLTAWQCDAFHAGERAMIGRRGSDSPYTTPHARVTVARSDSPLAAGSYRSLGGAVNHFAREVHMDEIADAVDADPVELRLRHLAEPRYRRVLERAAEDFGWDGRAGSGVGIGLDVGSYSAVCLQADAQPAEVRVERVASALDCGLTVKPDGAVNQMEGAIVMGIGNALFEAIDFEQGRLLNANLARYRVPRIVDTPSISVALVGAAETASTGAGEPGIVPTAPAISNAVFSATGERGPRDQRRGVASCGGGRLRRLHAGLAPATHAPLRAGRRHLAGPLRSRHLGRGVPPRPHRGGRGGPQGHRRRGRLLQASPCGTQRAMRRARQPSKGCCASVASRASWSPGWRRTTASTGAPSTRHAWASARRYSPTPSAASTSSRATPRAASRS